MFRTGNMGECSGWRQGSERSQSRRRTDIDMWEGLRRKLGPYHARSFDQWRLRPVCATGSGRVSRRGGKFPIGSIG